MHKVPSGSRITGTGAVRKLGWLGHGAGVGYNVMWPQRGKGLLLEAVAEDSNGTDVATIVVRLDDMKMYGQRHCCR